MSARRADRPRLSCGGGARSRVGVWDVEGRAAAGEGATDRGEGGETERGGE